MIDVFLSLFGNEVFLLLTFSVFFILLAYGFLRIRKILKGQERIISHLQKQVNNLNNQLKGPFEEFEEELELLKENQLKIIDKLKKKS
jgi:F0F1-type ATP synthase membrane subunit b/b'